MKKTSVILLAALLCTILSTCRQETVLPECTIITSSDIQAKVLKYDSLSVTLQATLLKLDADIFREVGFCFDTGINPTSKVSGVTKQGKTFTVTISSLEPYTKYHFKAFADATYLTISTQTEEVQTLPKVPVIEKCRIKDIRSQSATIYGNVAGVVDEWGYFLSKDKNFTQDEKIKQDNPGGNIDWSNSTLDENSTYYVKVYAQNSSGEATAIKRIITSAKGAPIVETDESLSKTATSATCGGTVLDDNAVAVTKRGVVWSTHENPMIDDCDGSADGQGYGSTFTCSIEGLQNSTTYFVRAYATNARGTGYGNDIEFTTDFQGLGSVSTDSIIEVSFNTAKCQGTVISDGGLPITQRGMVWGLTSNPEIGNCAGQTNDGSGTGTFESNLTGLATGTSYYVRAYATNSAGTAYGTELVFKTKVSGNIEDYGTDPYEW